MRYASVIALAVGVGLATCGSILWAHAEQFAPDWQSPDQAVLGGVTGLRANRFYENIGLIVLVFGASLSVAALWSWFSESRRDRRSKRAGQAPPLSRA